MKDNEPPSAEKRQNPAPWI